MDVFRLRLFREVAERGTLRAAAEAMSLTPSAVSQQLKILQREAGVALLEPEGRRLRLTDAGQVLVARADEVLAALDLAQAEMDAYRSTPRGTVRVSMFPSGAAMLMARLITDAARDGVHVEGRDIDRPAADAAAQLADFDVVVVHRDEREPADVSARTETTFLLREPLEIVVPPQHRLAAFERIALTDLADDDWIGVESGLMVDDVLRSLATLTGVRPRIAQRVNDFRVVEELVSAGLGVALLPRYVVTARDLPRKPLDGIRVARRIEAVTRSGAAMRPAVATVLRILQRCAHETAEHNTRPQ